MNRRAFLSSAATAGGLALLGGGFWARQAYARSQLTQELLRHANPVLAAKAQQELLTLPEQAREEMRRYFHGVCLNVHGFASEVASPDFASRLAACTTKQRQQELVLLVFMREVVTETQVVNRVQIIAEEVSRDLNRNWATCCRDLADKWDVTVRGYKATVTAAELGDRLEPVVRDGIHQALEEARSAGQRPVLADFGEDVEQAALLLMQTAQQAPWIGWPLFAVLALRPVFDFFIGQVKDRSANIQWAVSERLATLGNRMGSEFENEVRLRITDLHKWQDHAVERAAQKQAEQLVRLL